MGRLLPADGSARIIRRMTLNEFIASTKAATPPAGISEGLRALWHAEKGEWDTAHGIAQAIPHRDGSWIHAHLHRDEGDLWNARYWYDRAGRPESKQSIADERHEIIAALLGAG